MRPRRIVLVGSPGGGSQEAVARVKSLGGLGEVDVTVLSATNDVAGLFRDSGIDVDSLIRGEHRRHVDAIVEDLEQSGIRAAAKVRVGVPFVEMIREVLESEADFLIKVSERAGTKSLKLSCTDMQLLRKCPCPVWITRPREHVPYKRVLAAVDPCDERPGADIGLDTQIVRWATSIGRLDGAQLTLLHTWELRGENMLSEGRARIPAAELERYRETTRLRHERRFAEFVARQDLSGLDHDCQLRKGPPAQVIPDVVEEVRADLLVMGTVARTGISGFFIGNTAEEAIQQVSCAVITVKPNGFVSPIRVD